MSSYEARITKADASNTWVASAYTWYYAGSAPCIGTRVSPCQNVPADRQLAWSPNGAGISPANPLPDGAYNVTLGARDAVGKTTWMVTQPLKIDRTAPTVSPESNLSSLNGKTVAGGAYSLTVTGSDATSGIGGVAVYDTFNNVTTLVASSGGPSASWNLNADDANNQGTHNYSFVSYDNAGNASSAGTATITVDQYRYGTAQSTAPSKYFGWYNTSLFDEPLWQQLHTKTFRISVWWNAVSTRGGVLINGVLIDKFNDFTTLVNQALAKGQQVVVSIDSSEEYDNKAKPTPAQYHDAVQQLYLAEPNVAYWGVANEPNAGRTWLCDLPSTTINRRRHQGIWAGVSRQLHQRRRRQQRQRVGPGLHQSRWRLRGGCRLPPLRGDPPREREQHRQLPRERATRQHKGVAKRSRREDPVFPDRDRSEPRSQQPVRLDGQSPADHADVLLPLPRGARRELGLGTRK
jgi:hypothetical protein